MPPKTKRLQTRDFVNTQKSSTYKTGLFDVKILFNNKSKFACVVKKNISRTAVLRNKTRRKIYSILTSVFIDEKYSVVVYPKKQSLTTPFQKLISEMKKIKGEIKK